MNWHSTPKTLLFFLIAVGSVLPLASGDELTSEQRDFFEAKVRPLLASQCYECHSATAKKLRGGLMLDSKWGWETGGDSGPAIVPGKPEESLLIEAVRREEETVSAMPPKTKLSSEQVANLVKWVEMGAPDPRPKVERGAHTEKEKFDLAQRRKEHWSWRPIAAPSNPKVANKEWPRRPLDHFVLAKLEQQKLIPALEADKRTWLRRVYFDIIGLPPNRQQIAAFLADKSDEAYDKVVEELLNSPHYGEKWARHWMDLVRYAETYGHEFDYPIRYAHEYRDYLIRAFNLDVPYDQFVREHIAGDLLKHPRRHKDEQYNESILGTAFWFLHEATHAPTDVLGNESDIVDNQLDVFGKSFLGLTIACARCHDHKFDAISTADYYALSAYIQSSCRQEYPLDPGQRIGESSRQIDQILIDARQAIRNTNDERLQVLRPGPYFAAAAKLLRETNPQRPANGANY